MKLGSAHTTTLAHPDHFDSSKFGPDGARVDLVRYKGRRPKLRPDEAEQLLFLDLVVRTAQRDLVAYLVEKGYPTKGDQANILMKLRRGWRPQR